MGLSEARICQVRAQAVEHLRRFVNRMSEPGL
jgi:DNA-directed RNA polymerase specialized sigma subunit